MADSRNAILARLAASRGPHVDAALEQFITHPFAHPRPPVGDPLACFSAALKGLGVRLWQRPRNGDLGGWLRTFLADQGHRLVAQCLAPTYALDLPLAEGGETDCLVTGVDLAVAETGSLMLCTDQPLQSRSLFLSRHHVALVREEQVQAHLEQAWAELRNRARAPARIHLISGPSRTADVEQTLVVGAHGPVALDVVLLTGRH